MKLLIDGVIILLPGTVDKRQDVLRYRDDNIWCFLLIYCAPNDGIDKKVLFTQMQREWGAIEQNEECEQ